MVAYPSTLWNVAIRGFAGAFGGSHRVRRHQVRKRERERENERGRKREGERESETERGRKRKGEREREREQCEAFALQPASSTSPGFRGTKENKVVWVRTLDRPSSGNELRPFAS